MDAMRNGARKKHDLITWIFSQRACQKEMMNEFPDTDMGRLVKAFPDISSAELRRYVGTTVKILREYSNTVELIADRLVKNKTVRIE